MAEAAVVPAPSRELGYPTLRPGARWTVAAGSVGVSVEPELALALKLRTGMRERVFFTLDFLTTSAGGSPWWRPVRAGKAFVSGWTYRLRRGADTTALAALLDRRRGL